MHGPKTWRKLQSSTFPCALGEGQRRIIHPYARFGDVVLNGAIGPRFSELAYSGEMT